LATLTASDIQICRLEPADRQGVINVILPIQREEFGIEINARTSRTFKPFQTSIRQGSAASGLPKQAVR
jgi:hypothetical protein